MAGNGCFIAILIARTHDKVSLCSYTDENYSNANTVRQQEQRILELMETPASAQQRAEAKGSYYQSFDHRDCIFFAFQDAATDLTIITAVNKLLLRNSGDVAGMNRIACGLINMVFAEFTLMYNPEEITDKRVRPFQFIKFDTTLQKCIRRVVQEDRGASDGLMVGSGGGGLGGEATGPQRRQAGTGTAPNPHYDALRQEITDVHFVMRKNLDDLMKRGEKFDTMKNYSSEILDQSSTMYKSTVRMNRMRLVRMYGPPAIVIAVFLLCLYIWIF